MRRKPRHILKDTRIISFAERLGESGIRSKSTALTLARAAWGMSFSPAKHDLFMKHFLYGRERSKLAPMLRTKYPKQGGVYSLVKLGKALRMHGNGVLWENEIPPSRLFTVLGRILGRSLSLDDRNEVGIGYYSETSAPTVVNAAQSQETPR